MTRLLWEDVPADRYPAIVEWLDSGWTLSFLDFPEAKGAGLRGDDPMVYAQFILAKAIRDRMDKGWSFPYPSGPESIIDGSVLWIETDQRQTPSPPDIEDG